MMTTTSAMAAQPTQDPEAKRLVLPLPDEASFSATGTSVTSGSAVDDVAVAVLVLLDGAGVGSLLVGNVDGLRVGAADGGTVDGDGDGLGVGRADGAGDGAGDGKSVGLGVGFAVVGGSQWQSGVS